MEEMFQCPRCGKNMAEGRMPGGYNHHLEWRPGCDARGWKRTLQGPPFWKKGSLKDGFYLVPRGNQLGVVYLPAHICPECQLVILDYDPEKAELDSRTAKFFVDR